MIEGTKRTKKRIKASVGVGGLLSDVYMDILDDLGYTNDNWAHLRKLIMAYARHTLERQRPPGSEEGISRAKINYVYGNVFRELVVHRNMSMGKYLTGLMVVGVRRVDWTQEFTHQDGRVTAHKYSFGVGETGDQADGNATGFVPPPMMSIEDVLKLVEKYADNPTTPLSAEADDTGVF
jgi:hypothetical protein